MHMGSGRTFFTRDMADSKDAFADYFWMLDFLSAIHLSYFLSTQLKYQIDKHGNLFLAIPYSELYHF